jgi:hypothetical protein
LEKTSLGYKKKPDFTYKDFKPTPLQNIASGVRSTRHDVADVERSFDRFPYRHSGVRLSEHALQHVDQLGVDQNKLQEDLQNGLFNHIGTVYFTRQDQPPQGGYILEMAFVPNAFVMATNVDGELFVESVHDSPEYWSVERYAPPAVEGPSQPKYYPKESRKPEKEL